MILRHRLAAGARALVRRSAAVATSAFVWLGLLFGIGTLLVVSGVDTLFGRGWAMIAAGLPLLALAVLVARGIANG